MQISSHQWKTCVLLSIAYYCQAFAQSSSSSVSVSTEFKSEGNLVERICPKFTNLTKDYRKTCLDKCDYNNCTSNKKCCLTPCGYVCLKPIVRFILPKQGNGHPKCPELKPDHPSNCIKRCNLSNNSSTNSNSSGCPSDQICCSSGCGTKCTKPFGVHIFLNMTGHNCPKPKSGMPAPCYFNCSLKGQGCGLEYLCCFNGCGYSCLSKHRPGDINSNKKPPSYVINGKTCPTPDQRGECKVSCGTRIPCSQGEVCCFNGCGLECMKPSTSTSNNKIDLFKSELQKYLEKNY